MSRDESLAVVEAVQESLGTSRSTQAMIFFDVVRLLTFYQDVGALQLMAGVPLPDVDELRRHLVPLVAQLERRDDAIVVHLRHSLRWATSCHADCRLGLRSVGGPKPTRQR